MADQKKGNLDDVSAAVLGEMADVLEQAKHKIHVDDIEKSEVTGAVEDALSHLFDDKTLETKAEPEKEPAEPEITLADEDEDATTAVFVPEESESGVEVAEVIAAKEAVGPSLTSVATAYTPTEPEPKSAPERTKAAKPAPVSAKPPRPAPTGARPRSSGRKASRLVIPVVILLGLAIAAWFGRGLFKSEGETAPPETEVAAPVTPEPVVETAAAPPVTGILIIDSQPWAEVDRIWDSSGSEIELSEDRITPLRLELPVQNYSVILIHPSSGLSRICKAQVTDSEITLCQLPATEAETLDLFKETGWYR